MPETLFPLTLSEYQTQALKTAIFPADTGVVYTTLGLAGEAAEIANKVKKILRDNGGNVTLQHGQEIGKEIGDVLWYCAALAAELGLDLGAVAEVNLAKLASRAERGTLQGSGDSR